MSPNRYDIISNTNNVEARTPSHTHLHKYTFQTALEYLLHSSVSLFIFNICMHHQVTQILKF